MRPFRPVSQFKYLSRATMPILLGSPLKLLAEQELPAIRYHRAGDERADARNGHQLAATLAAMRQNLDLFGDVLDTLIQTLTTRARRFTLAGLFYQRPFCPAGRLVFLLGHPKS
jgi:hypothetical protein